MSTGGRERADRLLVLKGLAETRARARALIADGKVLLGGEVLGKPAQLLPHDAELSLAGGEPAWVSRGALKLVAALDRFGFDPSGRVALDIGASAGGFTEVLLARGARRVYAVDVGRDQLHPRLKGDPRVVSREGVNARELSAAEVPEAPEFITCDTSFIGLRTVLPAPLRLAAPGALLVALIKPQFEAGPDRVGKGGVVRDANVREAVCRTIADWLNGLPGWHVEGLIESPITGPKGNVEYLIGARHAA